MLHHACAAQHYVLVSELHICHAAPMLTVIFILLMLFWLSCSQYFDIFFVVSGVISSLLSIHLFRIFSNELCINNSYFGNFSHKNSSLGRANYNILIYIFWLLWQIILSGLQVMLVIWNFKDKLYMSGRVVEVKPQDTSFMGIAILANSITLTPGTVSVDINNDSNIIYVHALTAELADDVQSDSIMKMKVVNCIHSN